MKTMVYSAISKLRVIPLAMAVLFSPYLSAIEPLSPAPGITIDNRAQAFFTFEDNPLEVIVIPSNLSTVRTGFDYGLDLQADQNINAVGGQLVSFPHTLINQGNAPDVYDVAVTNLIEDQGDLTGLFITLDINGNGVEDAGEPEITQTTIVPAGGTVNLIVTGSVPPNAEVSDQIRVQLDAISVGDPTQRDSNIDTLNIVQGALLRFTKTSSVACSVPLLPGERFTYDIGWSNTGASNPIERLHTVDGVQMSGVMIEDRLPPDVDLVPGQTLGDTLNIVPSGPFGGQLVVMTAQGLIDNEWISYDDWSDDANRPPVARLGLLTPANQLRPNQLGRLTFDVTVSENATLNSRLENQVVVDEDGDEVDFEFASSVVCNVTGGPQAEIRFLSPTFDNVLEQRAPEFDNDDDFTDNLRYRFDANLDDYNATFDGVYVELSSTSIPNVSLTLFEDGRRQVIVNVTSQISGETVPTVVRETALGSGVYRNIIPLVLILPEAFNGTQGSQSVSSSRTASVVSSSTLPGVCGDFDIEADFISEPPVICTLPSGEGDILTVTFFDLGIGALLDDDSIVDPLGLVFDAISLEPVPGSEVRIFNAVDNGPGGLQDELAINPLSLTGEPLEVQITNDQGLYQFPFIFPGSYYMEVTTPANSGRIWPSVRNPLLYPGLDTSDISYGLNGFSGVVNSGVFTLDENSAIIGIDFPVDPVQLDLVVSGTTTCDIDASTDDPIFYELAFANTGNLIPPERNILIDDIPATGVVIEALVPLNTAFDAAVIPVFSPVSAELILNLYDGTPLDSWVDYDTWIALPEADRPLVRSVGLLIPATDLEPPAPGVDGEGGDLSYGVLLGGNITAGTQVGNRVSVDFDGDNQPEIVSDDDFQEACEFSTGPEPAIRFVTPDNGGAVPVFEQDDTFTDTGVYLIDGIGNPYDTSIDGVYVELNSTSIAEEDFVLLEDGRRTIIVNVASGLTADDLELILEETEYASGVYRSIRPLNLHDTDIGNGGICPPTADGADYINDPGPECILNGDVNDLLTTSFLHRFEDDVTNPETTLVDTAVVAPIGFVFLSSGTFDPVGSALVRIRRVTGPGTSEVAAGPFVTAANGAFPFPNDLPNGEYFIDVESTDTFTFASEVDLAILQANSGFNVSSFSFGFDGGAGVFTISDANPVVVFDIPVDPAGGNASLVVTKAANTDRVQIGGLIEYSVTVSNVGDGVATNVQLIDSLPFGFKYIEDTSRRDAVLVADPAGNPGPELTYPVGDLGAGETTEFMYVLQATSGALDSDGINTAQANGMSGGSTVVSNQARVRVDIELTGVLSERGIIFGKVFVDADCNNIQSHGEWPIGGVALYLEDGTFAITDENGQYSIYGINPGVHSIKVDPLTLPEGVNLKPLDNRNLASADSRVVDLITGEFHRADFAGACPHPSEAEFVYTQVVERNTSIQGDWLSANSASFDVFERAAAQSSLSDGDLSSGTLLDAGQLNSGSALVSQATGLSSGVDYAATSEEEVSAAVVVEEIIYEIEAEEGRAGMWLWPLDDISLYGRFVVAVRDRVQADLYVNGNQVPREQIGEEAHNTATDVQALAWYGVRLEPGENLVEVKTTDSFGNARVLLSNTFASPSQAVSLEIEPESDVLAADGGRSVMPIEISVRDESGYLARGLHFITVEASDGRILGEDLQPDTQGFQVRLDRGTATINLASSNNTGDVEIRASNNDFDESVSIDFIAAQRSLLVSGIASANAGICDISSDGFDPTNADCADGVQDERLALFLKGSIRGNMFLTLSYDSEKTGDAELLRDINPDEYYPIFGDSSVRGFEAQSRSKLYAKLELDRSYIEWGDFTTDRNISFQDLGRVQRSLTGFSGVYEGDNLSAEVFAAEIDDTRETIEIPGNGTAMLFSIPAAPVVRNSEVIEIIVRDRENIGLIISATNLTRFLDYTLDDISGDIRFTRTIPSIDENLNPVSLRISYDIEGAADTDVVAGVRANYEFSEELVVGGSYTLDGNATTGFDLASTFVEFNPTETSRIFISAATMDHEDDSRESGNALYAELEMTWENGSHSIISFGRAEEGFTNNGSGVSADRQELRAEHSQVITRKLSFDTEVIRSEGISTDDVRESLELSADYAVGDWVFTLGARRLEQSSAGSETDTANTIVAGAGRSFVLFERRGNINLGAEREVGNQNRQRLSLGGSWQAHEKLNVYGNIEQIDSLAGTTSLSSDDQQIIANFGFETDFLPSTSIFNEYRMRGVSDGRDLEAATGVRGDYVITEGLTISPSIEMIDILDGDEDRDSFAISIGIEDLRSANSRSLARIETRVDDNQTNYGLDLSYVARIGLNWSSFVREEASYTEISGAENTLSHQLTLGLTHRPRETNKYHALYLYQWAEEKAEGLLGDRSYHLLSTHQNYQFNESLRLSGRLGAKYETTPLLSSDFSSLTAVMDTRLIWDITRRLDFDVHAGLLGTNSFEETRYSFGAGLSYLVIEGLRVGLGYNLTGFDEGDLDTEGFNQQGFYLHAEYKFDEDLFRWLESDLYRKEEEE